WSLACSSLPSFPTRRSSDLLDVTLGDLGDDAIEARQVGVETVPVGIGAAAQKGQPDHRDKNGENIRFALFHMGVKYLFVGRYSLDRKSTRLNSSHVKISYAV